MSCRAGPMQGPASKRNFSYPLHHARLLDGARSSQRSDPHFTRHSGIISHLTMRTQLSFSYRLPLNIQRAAQGRVHDPSDNTRASLVSQLRLVPSLIAVLDPYTTVCHRHTPSQQEPIQAQYTSQLKHCSHLYSGKELDASISVHTAEHSLLTAVCLRLDGTRAALATLSSGSSL